MANHALLNNVDHKELKVITRYGADLGDNLMCVPVYPVEARHAQAHYPLLFTKDANGAYQMVALFGFEQGENLFLQGDSWHASYKPLLVEKGPFLIGRNQKAGEQTLSIHVDLDHPRISEQEGEPVFLPHGGNSDFIENIANVLSTIHQSQTEVAAFIDALQTHKLIESFVVDIDMGSTGTHRLSGFFTIDEEALKALDATTLGELHSKGYLETIYMMVASLSQLRHLVALKKASVNG